MRSDVFAIQEILLFGITFNLTYATTLLVFYRTFSKHEMFKFDADEYLHNEYLTLSTSYSLANLCLFILIVITLATNIALKIKTGNWLGGAWLDDRISGVYGLAITYFNVIGSLSVYLLYIQKRYKSMIIALIFCLLLILSIKARAMMLPMVIPFAYHYMFIKKRLIICIPIAVCVIFFGLLLQQLRYLVLEDHLQINVFTILDNIARSIQEGQGEFSLIDAYIYVISNKVKLVSYGEAHTFRRILFFFLPKNSFFKPDDFSFAIWNAYTGVLGVGGSMHPTLYGKFHLNFGFIGFFYSFLLWLKFIVLRHVIAKFNVPIIAVWSSIGIGCILFARGSYYNGFFQMIISAILMIVLFKIVSYRDNKTIISSE